MTFTKWKICEIQFQRSPRSYSYDSSTSGNMLIFRLYIYKEFFFLYESGFFSIGCHAIKKRSRCQTYSLTTNQQPILSALTDTETLQQFFFLFQSKQKIHR